VVTYKNSSSSHSELLHSTRYLLERNPVYGTKKIAITPEIETSANIAYEHMVLSQSLTTNPAVVSARPPPSPMHSLERADEGTDLPPLNPNIGDTTEDSTVENTNSKCRVPNPDVDVSEDSTNFNPVWY
jgi:hypothetical protein